MRLNIPKVRSLHDYQTGAELSYVGESANRDMMGTIYQAKIPVIDHLFEVDAICGSLTSLMAKKHAKECGIDYYSLTITEQLAFSREFSSAHGSLYNVPKFRVHEICDDDTLFAIRNGFLKLVFDLLSSFKYNCDDELNENGYYPDCIQFYPYNVDRRLCGTFKREDV